MKPQLQLIEGGGKQRQIRTTLHKKKSKVVTHTVKPQVCSLYEFHQSLYRFLLDTKTVNGKVDYLKYARANREMIRAFIFKYGVANEQGRCFQ